MKSIAQYLKENNISSNIGAGKNKQISDGMKRNWVKRREEKERINNSFSSTQNK